MPSVPCVLDRPAPTARSRRLRSAFWWTATLTYMALIWTLSSRQNLNTVVRLPFPHADKLIHMVEFGGLAFLACQALWVSGRSPGIRGRALCAFLLACTYGGLDEWHQSHVPTRAADPVDWLADTVGAAGVVFLWCRLFPAPAPIRDEGTP